MGRKRNKRWTDIRPDYGALAPACAWIKKSERVNLPLSVIWDQPAVAKRVAQQKQQMCSPASVDGFCEDSASSSGGAPELCTLTGGRECSNGRVLPHSLTNDMANYSDITLD